MRNRLINKLSLGKIKPITIVWICLVLWTLLIYAPSLRLSFSLIDDGFMVRTARQVYFSLVHFDFKDILNLVFESYNGRVRPVYWIIESIITWLGLYSASIIHAWRLLILFISMILTNKLLKELKVRGIWRIISIFVFITNIQNFENYYRLGPAEPFLVLCLLLLLYFIFFYKYQNLKWYLLSATVLLIGSFTKEYFFLSSLSLAPLIFLPLKTNKKRLSKRLIFLSCLSIVAGIVIFIIKSKYPGQGEYASNYILSSRLILGNLKIYISELLFLQTPFLPLSFLYLIFFLYKLSKNRLKNIKIDEVFLIALWILIAVQLIVLAPWRLVFGRYLAIVNITLALTYAISLNWIFKLVTNRFPMKYKKYELFIYSTVSLLVISPFFVRNLISDANYQLFQGADVKMASNTLTSLANQIGKDETVYVNYLKGDKNLEIFLETGWHLQEFYEREDIKFEYLDKTNLCTTKERYIFDRSSTRQFNPKLFLDGNTFQVVDKGKTQYERLNYKVIVNSFKYLTKLPKWSSTVTREWGLYIQKANTCIASKYII